MEKNMACCYQIDLGSINFKKFRWRRWGSSLLGLLMCAWASQVHEKKNTKKGLPVGLVGSRLKKYKSYFL